MIVSIYHTASDTYGDVGLILNEVQFYRNTLEEPVLPDQFLPLPFHRLEL